MGLIVGGVISITLVFIFLFLMIEKLCKKIKKGDFEIEITFLKIFKVHIRTSLKSSLNNKK